MRASQFRKNLARPLAPKRQRSSLRPVGVSVAKRVSAEATCDALGSKCPQCACVWKEEPVSSARERSCRWLVWQGLQARADLVGLLPLEGQGHRESSGSPRREDATRLLRLRTAEYDSGARVAGQETVTWETLWEGLERHYVLNRRKSLRELRYKRAVLHAAFGGLAADLITPTQIKRYTEHRLEAVSAATINIELAYVRMALRIAVEDGVVAKAPRIKTLTPPKPRWTFLDPDEFRAVLAELPDDGLRDFARFAYLTGCRRGEIERLEWADVREDSIRLGDTKEWRRPIHSGRGGTRRAPRPAPRGRGVGRAAGADSLSPSRQADSQLPAHVAESRRGDRPVGGDVSCAAPFIREECASGGAFGDRNHGAGWVENCRDVSPVQHRERGRP